MRFTSNNNLFFFDNFLNQSFLFILVITCVSFVSQAIKEVLSIPLPHIKCIKNKNKQDDDDDDDDVRMQKSYLMNNSFDGLKMRTISLVELYTEIQNVNEKTKFL